MAKAAQHLKLASADGATPQTGARQHLAEAQETLKDARTELEALGRAANVARDNRWAAESIIESIAAGVTGDDGSFDSLLTALKGGDVPYSAASLLQPSEANKVKVERAEREIEAWRKAEETAKARIPDQSRYVGFLESRLDEAVTAVVRKCIDVEPLLARAETLRLELGECRAVLQYLGRGKRLHEDRKAAVSDYLGRWIDSFDHPTTQPWDRALRLLKEDHTAPLPSLPSASVA